VNYIKLSVEISKRGEKFNMNNDFIELNDIDTLEVAKPLKDKMNLLLSNIKDKILLVPGFIRMVKSFVPIKTLQAVLTNEQKEKIASGILKIMSKNDGTLVANLVDPQSGKIITNIPLKEIELTPELNKAMTDFALQLQLLQILDLQLVNILSKKHLSNLDHFDIFIYKGFALFKFFMQ